MVSKPYFRPIDEKIEEKIWKGIDKTKDIVKKDVEAIKTWLKSQSHLPQTLSDRQIEAFLLMGRGSVEKIKPKIDMYFSMRSLLPDFFKNSHPFSKRVLESKKYMYIVPVPKLSNDFSRFLIFKIKDVSDPAGMDPQSVFAYLMNIVEIRLQEDFCSGHTILFDLEYCKFNHIVKVTPSFIRNIHTVGEKALTTRVHGIHLLNAPKFFDQLVLLVKSIVKAKLGSKIFVHRDKKSVLETMDKNILPRDFGGNEKTLDELEEDLAEKFREYEDFFNQREKLKVNENLRPAGTINDDILGYHGNFKKLDFD